MLTGDLVRPRLHKYESELRVKLLDARLLASQEILPGQWLQTYDAPWLASGAVPGQFVHVRTPDWSGLVLRRPFSLNTYDRVTGQVFGDDGLTLGVR